MGKILPQILSMARGMQYKIDENSHKPGWISYDKDGVRVWDGGIYLFLKDKLHEECTELLSAIDMAHDKESIFLEACDVANIAMMLADTNHAIASDGVVDSLRSASESVLDLLIRKNQSYGDDNLRKFKRFGILVRVSDKVERLRHLLETRKDTVSESEEDTWRDIAGYALQALRFIEEEKHV